MNTRTLAPIAVVLAAAALTMASIALLRSRKPETVFAKSSEIMARYKGVVKVREELNKEMVFKREEAGRLDTQLRMLLKDGEPKDPKTRNQALELRRQMWAMQDQMTQREKVAMDPVLNDINQGIKKFAERHHYKLVLGTLQGGVVLHADEALDVTEALIKELNQ